MEIRLIEAPGECTICGGLPRDETVAGGPLLGVFVPLGVDVNWGEDLVICQGCAGVMADMMGRVERAKHEGAVEAMLKLQVEYDKLESRYEEQAARVQAIVKGRRAQKEVVNG